jgi:helix-turn-helix protein
VTVRRVTPSADASNRGKSDIFAIGENSQPISMSTQTNPSAITRTEGPVGALKSPDARKYLGGISVPTMQRLIQRGLLKPNRSLRHLLFPIAELDRFLRDG